jgi:hypothetical protein
LFPGSLQTFAAFSNLLASPVYRIDFLAYAEEAESERCPGRFESGGWALSSRYELIGAREELIVHQSHSISILRIAVVWRWLEQVRIDGTAERLRYRLALLLELGDLLLDLVAVLLGELDELDLGGL